MDNLLLLILKAKRRQVGETWTRPSGITVKKIAPNKIIPVPKGRVPKKKEDKTTARLKDAKPIDKKKKSGGFYTKFSRFLDKVKRVTGIGRSDVIQKGIEAEYEEAKKEGLNTKSQKFLMTYLEYFANKAKWDRLFSAKNKSRLSGFSSPGMLAVRDVVRSKRKSNKPYDRKAMRYLFEKFGTKEPGPLEVGQKIELDRNTRFKEYKLGSIQLLTGREESTQLPTMNYLDGKTQNNLSPHQQDGANLAMEKFHAGERGFLIADGTGGGKTRQALAVAESYLKTIDNQKPVIICTESDNILNTAWMDDAKAMGLEINNAKINGFKPGMINITTYSQAEKINNYDQLGLLIFDEAHNLKNEDSTQTKLAIEAMKKANHTLNCTATPVETIDHAVYIAESYGMDSQAVVKYLKGGKKSTAFDQALRFDSLMNDLTKKGLMVKREVSLSNLELHIKRVNFSKEDQKTIQDLTNQYKEKRGAANELMALRRVTEEKKVAEAINHVQRELAEGRQVVLFADRISDTELYGHKSEGTLPLLEKKLQELGISFESIYGGANKDTKDRVRRFQAGESQVILGNPESMGTGISLDDTTGEKPRTLISLTPPFSAMTFLQKLGRVNRLSTKSRSKAIMLSSDHYSDTWGLGILKNKAETLGAAVKGDYETIDLENGGSPTVGKKADPPPIDTDIFRKGKPVEEPEEIAKSELYYLVLKAKRRQIGETWTQPSGRKVKKIANGKIVPVSEGKKKEKKEKTKTKKPKVEEPIQSDTKGEKIGLSRFTNSIFPNLDSTNVVIHNFFSTNKFENGKAFKVRSGHRTKVIPSAKLELEKNKFSINPGVFDSEGKRLGESFYFNTTTHSAEKIGNLVQVKTWFTVDQISGRTLVTLAEIRIKDKAEAEKVNEVADAVKEIKESNKFHPTEDQIKKMDAGGRKGENAIAEYCMKLFYKADFSVSGIARKLVFQKDEDDIQDIISDTMEATIRNYQSGMFYGMSPSNINAYILATLKNKAMTFDRKLDNNSLPIDGREEIITDGKTVESDFLEKEQAMEDAKKVSEKIETIQSTVKDLKSKNKERNQKIWELYIAGKSNGKPDYKKIADILGITAETVKQQIKNIKRKVRGNESAKKRRNNR